jgi:hypothetical protein
LRITLRSSPRFPGSKKFTSHGVHFTQRSSPTAGGVQKKKEDKEKPSGRKRLGFSFFAERD